MMMRIAEAEEKEVQEAKQKKLFGCQERSHTGGSDITMGGLTDEDYHDEDNDDDYDNFVS